MAFRTQMPLRFEGEPDVAATISVVTVGMETLASVPIPPGVRALLERSLTSPPGLPPPPPKGAPR